MWSRRAGQREALSGTTAATACCAGQLQPREDRRVSLDHLAPYGLVHLGRGDEIGAYEIDVAEFHVTVVALRIQEIEQRGAAVLIGKLDRIANVHGLFEILALVRLQKIDVGDQGRIRGIDIAVDLGLGSLPQLLVPLDIKSGAQLFALVLVEDAQGNIDAGAQSIQSVRIVEGSVMREPKANRGISGSIGLGKLVICLRLLNAQHGGAKIGAAIEGILAVV